MRAPRSSGKPTATNLAWGVSLRMTLMRTQQTSDRSLNINSLYGPVVNPHQPPGVHDIPWSARERRSAGGSSGGSAASVAAGMCSAYVVSQRSRLFSVDVRCPSVLWGLTRVGL